MYKQSDRDTLIIGLKRHLLIAQDTTAKKETRLQSLHNVAEVLEYVAENISDAVSEEEQMLLFRVFSHMLVKVRKAIINIHHKPETFEEELGFLSVLHKV
jgi:hypothetical protein